MTKKFRKWLNPNGNAFVAVDNFDNDLTIGDCSRSINLDFSAYPHYYDHVSAETAKISLKQLPKERKRLMKKLAIMREALDVVEANINSTIDDNMAKFQAVIDNQENA